MAFWVVLSVLVLLIAFGADAPVGRVVTVGSSTLLSLLAGCFSKAGEGWVVALAGTTASFFLFWRRRFEASRAVFLVAMTGLLTGAAATIVRSLLGRTRPNSHELQGFYGIWHDSHCIIGKYEFGAFPSGHAATVIGLATAAWLIDRRLGVLTTVYAVLVTWARIAMGCHHFSDAVASAILGIYGAHLVLARLGPSVYCFGEYLQNAWLGRKGTPSQVPNHKRDEPHGQSGALS
ncbi:MAG TPA: phosphatase PAP2 family protein [Verrucomicrobiae bacterium]|nr:phosphatase PAP2 family protein [Verrucomicrobiae bacterium]